MTPSRLCGVQHHRSFLHVFGLNPQDDAIASRSPPHCRDRMHIYLGLPKPAGVCGESPDPSSPSTRKQILGP